MSRSVARELWDEQSVWSQAADRLRREISKGRSLALAVTVAIAILGSLAATLAHTADTAARVLAGGAAFGALLLPLIRPMWSGEALKNWTRARSVSEGLKSEIYLYLAQVGAYAGADATEQLRAETAPIQEAGADLLRYRLGILPRERDLPSVQDPTTYFDVRVADQIASYYEPRAGRLQTMLTRFRIAEYGLALAGAAIGGVAAAVGGMAFAPWIAAVSTVSAAFAVHVAASRYEFQLIEFLRTAKRLRELRSAAAATADPTEKARLVAAAENAISTENKGWMAKLSQDLPQPAPNTEPIDDVGSAQSN